MTFNNRPYCNRCNGTGNIFSNIEKIENNPMFPYIETCSLCSGLGVNIKSYNTKQYSGEVIQYSGSLGPRVGIFMKEISRNSSQILLGRRLLVVPNDDITFLRRFHVNFYPMFDKAYRKTIYETLGLI